MATTSMPKYGDFAKAVFGIIGTLVTSAMLFIASMAYNMDRTITVMAVNLEHSVKNQMAQAERIADHESRIRDLEVRVGRRPSGDN